MSTNTDFKNIDKYFKHTNNFFLKMNKTCTVDMLGEEKKLKSISHSVLMNRKILKFLIYIMCTYNTTKMSALL